eukprot:171708-Rhodomonas_salina.2
MSSHSQCVASGSIASTLPFFTDPSLSGWAEFGAILVLQRTEDADSTELKLQYKCLYQTVIILYCGDVVVLRCSGTWKNLISAIPPHGAQERG